MATVRQAVTETPTLIQGQQEDVTQSIQNVGRYPVRVAVATAAPADDSEENFNTIESGRYALVTPEMGETAYVWAKNLPAAISINPYVVS